MLLSPQSLISPRLQLLFLCYYFLLAAFASQRNVHSSLRYFPEHTNGGGGLHSTPAWPKRTPERQPLLAVMVRLTGNTMAQ
ncbi:hypothetical protein E2C01_007244 [Portunus trituberculatus]|uniref:Uncharacterized protein n=1 Tax=Portunus trituberculatus TaxID=210409 RepID=A0A5B7CXC0_PORTR|nr:hypothetical protein [Portunus trituberculatus]